MEKEIFGFVEKTGHDEWVVANNKVVGGVSRNEAIAGATSSTVFQRNISLHRSGGFLSTRAKIRECKLSGFQGLRVRAWCDGKKYKFRLKTDRVWDNPSYQAEFEAEERKWVEKSFPFTDLIPTFCSNPVSGHPPLNPAQIIRFGFLISDRQSGPFRLEIDWIKAVLLAEPEGKDP